MRKVHRQQILEVVASMHAAHQHCRDYLSGKAFQAAQGLLTDCQDAAIQIGELIEQLDGEGTEPVAFLEQYCERLYQVNVQIEMISPQKAYKHLEEVLLRAENAIRHMRLRKEVVFLPYKASMWDSLESVYLAAREDEECDAYVVPIPYYDKLPDDSLGELHYEGDEYPSDIEITHYEAYDLEQRHPDVIYIHNPYDRCNVVTCVPERYFSSNLKRYTDCLVYIPYFVLDEIEPDNQEAIDTMKHFCFLPGTIWADKVIVQSEKMRQIYINEYRKAAKEVGLSGEHTDRKKLEEKILGLGSPKLDKVHRTNRESMEIPEAWRKIIEKPDGTWKKIIFYNTSIGAMLQSEEKMLQKMKSVFQTFKEQQEEVALLWRPHPLLESTIKAMKPQMRAEYEKLVQEYRTKGWGIYDDTAELDRAVVLSDAYYGDRSSVVQVYQETGKPVMIQNVEIL